MIGRMAAHAGVSRSAGMALVIGLACSFPQAGFAAQTLKEAIFKALNSNPGLNAQRASVRATKEKLSQAQAAFFPKINATADIGFSTQSGRSGLFGNLTTFDYQTHPKSFGVEATQNIFDGWRTTNTVQQSRKLIDSTIETFQAQEQLTIFNAANAYLNVLRDIEIEKNQRDNANFVNEQYIFVNGRHSFGDVTQTELNQAKSHLAVAKSQLLTASAALAESRALFEQIIGNQPGKLVSPPALDALAGISLEKALQTAAQQHPGIRAAKGAASAAWLQVKITEADFSPKIGVTASLGKRFDVSTRGDTQLSGSVIGKLTVPLFDGGEVSSRSRQSRELAAQRQLETDAVSAQVKSSVMTSWNQYQIGKSQVASAQQQISTAQIALSGMVEEYRYGLRTMLDVLNAQQDLLYARNNYMKVQHDRVLATFSLALATGRLTQENVLAGLVSGKAVLDNSPRAPPEFALRKTIKPGQAKRSHSCEPDCQQWMQGWNLKPGATGEAAGVEHLALRR